jgi:SAM-dependent methyltransferase
MLDKCNICQGTNLDEIYRFTGKAVTSVYSEGSEDSSIYFCSRCGHVVTEPLVNITEYYANNYDFGIGSEEEDQLLKIIDGKRIYRYAYQAETLIKILDIHNRTNCKILDFGAAKSSTLKKLYNSFPNLDCYVYDVSANYKQFWDNFIPQSNQFIDIIPDEYNNYFDIVCSFFMLEHVAEPIEILKEMHQRLNVDGVLYCVIPNLYENHADLMILDHVNHFSRDSLMYGLKKTGFHDIEIDERVNDGWFVITAKKSKVDKSFTKEISLETNEIRSKAFRISNYWKKAQKNISDFIMDSEFAIYGAGFYGNYILLNLCETVKPSFFIDQNPFLHGKEIQGIPVVDPSLLPENIENVVVGINPLAADLAMQSILPWKDRDLKYIHLFEN